jgi:hypothetical protein
VEIVSVSSIPINVKYIGVKHHLTIATIAIPSSQPKTLRIYILTYRRMPTKIRGTIDIIHITPFTVGARVSDKKPAFSVECILNVVQKRSTSKSEVYPQNQTFNAPSHKNAVDLGY